MVCYKKLIVSEVPYAQLIKGQGYTMSWALQGNKLKLLEFFEVPEHGYEGPGFRGLYILSNPGNKYKFYADGNKYNMAPGSAIAFEPDKLHCVRCTDAKYVNIPAVALQLIEHYDKAEETIAQLIKAKAELDETL